MKKNLTELVFILDRSGSMLTLVNETIGGFNSMVQKYKEELEEAYITTVLFDNYYEKLHNHINVKEIDEITTKDYYARGTTALYDAVGKTINSIGERLANTAEEERPEKVIFVIITDGYENTSHEFTQDDIKGMIEHQKNKYSWEFMFLGANIDAESEAEAIGISKDYAATYSANSKGVGSVYDTVGKITATMACCDSAMDSSTVRSMLNSGIANDDSSNFMNTEIDDVRINSIFVGDSDHENGSVWIDD